MPEADSREGFFAPTPPETDPWQFADFGHALARSRETDRPVFLYWGTKWCPPCAEMQVTVLQRSQFAARCARMVTVAIDGDAAGAQACGERMDVEVYPSMLVLGPDEREWIRLPCGLSESAFCSVLDAALRKRTPMSLLVDALHRTDGRLDEDTLRLLAFHYWPQERRIHPGEERLGLLSRLDASVLQQRPELAARVLTWHLIERASRPPAGSEPLLRERLYDRLTLLLDSPAATFSTLYYLLVGLEPVFGYLCQNSPARRDELTRSLHEVLERLVADPTLPWTERLIAHSAGVTLGSTPDTPSAAALVERTRALVMAADAATVGEVERQSVMNMAGHLLRQSGLREESIRLFRREIDRSPWPTYFMPYIAEMYLEQGEREEAFRWWLRSYEQTPGKTSRFELGVRYIAALVRHAPRERALIEGMVTRLLAERGDDADLTRARMRRSVRLLARTLEHWPA